MIKIHDIILFAISIFFMVILISNYITNYTNETKLIEANDLDYYTDLVAELGNVDADNNTDVDINRILSIAGNVNIPSKLRIHQPLTNLSIYPWNITENIDIDPNATTEYNNTVQVIAEKLQKPYEATTACYQYNPTTDGKGGCRRGPTFKRMYGDDDGDDVIKCYREQILCRDTSISFQDDAQEKLPVETVKRAEDDVKTAGQEATKMKNFEGEQGKAYLQSKK